MEIHENGHANQAGGCCCPSCGNTCGFHPEWSRQASDPTPLPAYEPDERELKAADEFLKRLIKKHSK